MQTGGFTLFWIDSCCHYYMRVGKMRASFWVWFIFWTFRGVGCRVGTAIDMQITPAFPAPGSEWLGYVCTGPGVKFFSWVKGSVCFVLKFALPPFSPLLSPVVQISKQNMHWTLDPINNFTPLLHLHVCLESRIMTWPLRVCETSSSSMQLSPGNVF